MRAVVQRVRNCRVEAQGKVSGSVESGLLVYLGVEKGDTEDEAIFLAGKISRLRTFSDQQGKMNLSLKDIGGKILVVSQFTLCADLDKGNRPSFDPAADPQTAKALYEKFVKALSDLGHRAETGVFGAHMKVSYENDGPVTFIFDTRSGKRPRVQQ